MTNIDLNSDFAAGSYNPDLKSGKAYGGSNKAEMNQDKFHNGAFEVIQPRGRGNRSGMDALLIAAALPKNSKGILADLGAGAGVAGFAALNLNKDLQLRSIEKNPEMAEFARQSALLPENYTFNDRVEIIEFDVTKSGVDRTKAGLSPDSVDYLIMNPPYNTKHQRPPKDAMRAEALVLGEGGIDAWFRMAAAIVKPGGTLVMIYRTENINEVIACCQGRFGGLEIMPIHSRKNEAAKRIIVRGTRASRAPLSILPGFVVHEENGNFTSSADAIFKGTELLNFAS